MMAKKPELLAPARDREAFLAAIAAGADAIYCGIAGGLNARRKAAGIAEDELPDLCAFAHARRARVYVTANIVVKQGELAGAIEALGRYAAAGVDAFIIQDWGLLAEVRRALPGAGRRALREAGCRARDAFARAVPCRDRGDRACRARACGARGWHPLRT